MEKLMLLEVTFEWNDDYITREITAYLSCLCIGTMDYHILLFFTLMALSSMTANSSENHPDDSKLIVGYGVEFSKIFK